MTLLPTLSQALESSSTKLIILNQIAQATGTKLKQRPPSKKIPAKKEKKDQGQSGQDFIARMKAKNKATIAQKQAEQDQEKFDYRGAPKKSLYQQNQDFKNKMNTKVSESYTSWKKEIQKTRKLWDQKHKEFLKKARNVQRNSV